MRSEWGADPTTTLKRKIVKTADGSHTIHLEDWDEHYHSKHGAIQEAYHVFIKNGLDHCRQKSLSILEMGFGTGLNAFITYLEAQKRGLTIDYVGIEAFPVRHAEIKVLNYVAQLQAEAHGADFELMHQTTWGRKERIRPDFELTKRKQLFDELTDRDLFNLIYFDAFGPRVQPELWTEKQFQKMHAALKAGGVLVTYSAKGSVRRAMQAVGFTVERLPGPPGKREMLRATK